MALSKYETLISTIKKGLKDESKALMERYTESKQLMLEAKVGYLPHIPPWKTLVHPENRNILGLNAHNAHRNGLKLYDSGADRQLLVQACATEMPPANSARYQEVIDFNKKLVRAAGGLLAEVTETEKFLTLGTGHTAAFCKATSAGAKSKYPKLADATGGLDANAIKARSKDFQLMIDEGWEFFVAPYWVDDEIPEWAPLAQRALNIHHNVAGFANEMETTCGLLDVLQDGKWDLAIESIAASEPMCKPYLGAIASLTKQIGSDLIVFMSNFLKNFGESVQMGHDFSEALAKLEVPKSFEGLRFFKAAFMITQLSSPECKVKDGVGRLLAVSDISSLNRKETWNLVAKAEKDLQTAWGKVKDGKFGETGIKVSCRCAIQVVLHVRQKEKWGANSVFQKRFKNTGEIIEEFNSDLDDQANMAAANKATPKAEKATPKAEKATPKAEDSSAKSEAKASTAVDVLVAEPNQELSALAKARGKFQLKIGSHYWHEDDKSYYQLVALDHKAATFVQHKVFGNTTQKQVPIEYKELKQFNLYKGKVQVRVNLGLDKYFVESASSMQDEAMKARAWTALAQAFAEQDTSKSCLQYTVHPTAAYVGPREFPKGNLQLVPMPSSLSKLSSSTADDAVCIVVDKVKWVLNPCNKAKGMLAKYMDGDLQEEKLKDMVVVPFWWVHPPIGKEAKEVNMKLSSIDQDGITVPVLINTRVVKENEKLVMLQPPKPEASKKAKKG